MLLLLPLPLYYANKAPVAAYGVEKNCKLIYARPGMDIFLFYLLQPR